jgi:hypothetical protein
MKAKRAGKRHPEKNEEAVVLLRELATDTIKQRADFDASEATDIFMALVEVLDRLKKEAEIEPLVHRLIYSLDKQIEPLAAHKVYRLLYLMTSYPFFADEKMTTYDLYFEYYLYLVQVIYADKKKSEAEIKAKVQEQLTKKSFFIHVGAIFSEDESFNKKYRSRFAAKKYHFDNTNYPHIHELGKAKIADSMEKLDLLNTLGLCEMHFHAHHWQKADELYNVAFANKMMVTLSHSRQFEALADCCIVFMMRKKTLSAMRMYNEQNATAEVELNRDEMVRLMVEQAPVFFYAAETEHNISNLLELMMPFMQRLQENHDYLESIRFLFNQGLLFHLGMNLVKDEAMIRKYQDEVPHMLLSENRLAHFSQDEFNAVSILGLERFTKRQRTRYEEEYYKIVEQINKNLIKDLAVPSGVLKDE